MEDYHILSKAEISALYQKRIKHFVDLADTFITQKWGTPASAPKHIKQKLVHFLAISDVYNSPTPIEKLLDTHYWKQLDDNTLPSVIDFKIRELTYDDTILSSTIRSGKALRETEGTLYPPIFQDSDRLYIQLPTIKNHPSRIQDIIQAFNKALPAEQALSFRTEKFSSDVSYFIADKSSEQPIGRFLGRKVSLLTSLSQSLATASPQKQNQIAHQIRTRDMYEYSEQNGHPIKVDWLKRDHHITLDPHLYTYIQHHLQTSSDSIDMIIGPLSQRLSSLKNSIAFEQDRQGDDEGVALEHDTNMIILSKSPKDIAWCSAYTDYGDLSCMNPNGFMHHFVREDIGHGTLVAYMVNSEQPYKRYSRILLKPYYNDHDEPIYFVGKTHGEKNYAFHQFLRHFARDYLNSPRTATYTIDKHLYPDSEPEKIVYSRLLEDER